MSDVKTNGMFVSGKLEGVDFSQSWRNENNQLIAGSVKLTFAFREKVQKSLNGVMIETENFIPVTIALTVPDEEIQPNVIKFNNLIGKHLDLRLLPGKNATFKLSSLNNI